VLKTHVGDPVPFVFYDSDAHAGRNQFSYNESDAKKSGVVVKKAYSLMDALIGGTKPWIETSH
ncbi:MAG: hypothetical protein ACREQP_05530, partial [Candidatus Binatia bacterium]